MIYHRPNQRDRLQTARLTAAFTTPPHFRPLAAAFPSPHSIPPVSRVYSWLKSPTASCLLNLQPATFNPPLTVPLCHDFAVSRHRVRTVLRPSSALPP